MAGQTQERATVVLAWRPGLLSSQREPRTVRTPPQGCCCPDTCPEPPGKAKNSRTEARRRTTDRLSCSFGSSRTGHRLGTARERHSALWSTVPRGTAARGQAPSEPRAHAIGPAPRARRGRPRAPLCRDTQRAHHDPARPTRPPAPCGGATCKGTPRRPSDRPPRTAAGATARQLHQHPWRREHGAPWHLPVSRRFPGDPSSTSESPQVLRDLFLGCRRVSNLGRTTDKKVLVPS